jgi:hypothetical protein
VRRLHYGAVEEADGRGEPGRRRRVREAGGGAGEEGRPEDEDALTCGPHTSAGQREREGRRREMGRVGRKQMWAALK